MFRFAFLFMLISSSVLAQSKAVAVKLEAIKVQHEKEMVEIHKRVMAKIAEFDQKYRDKLLALQDEATKAGDLDSALFIREELKKPVPVVSAASFDGEWEVQFLIHRVPYRKYIIKGEDIAYEEFQKPDVLRRGKIVDGNARIDGERFSLCFLSTGELLVRGVGSNFIGFGKPARVEPIPVSE